MSKFTREMIDDYANKLLIGLTEEENKVVLVFDIITIIGCIIGVYSSIIN